MPDPSSRKRLKKKMLDRWENEGGRIAPDTGTTDDTKPISKDEGRGKKRSSERRDSTLGTAASPAKTRKPARK